MSLSKAQLKAWHPMSSRWDDKDTCATVHVYLTELLSCATCADWLDLLEVQENV